MPWNAQGVVFNMYLQHLHCAILQFAFCSFAFSGVVLVFCWCALHAFTLLLKIELPEAEMRSQRSFECPSYILQFPIPMCHESVFSSTCFSLRVGVGSVWALRKVSVLKTSFSTPGFAALCQRVLCWERLLRLCSHQCVEIWQNMTQMTKYQKRCAS